MRSTKQVNLRRLSLLQSFARRAIIRAQLIQLLTGQTGQQAVTRLISLSHNPVLAGPERPAAFLIFLRKVHEKVLVISPQKALLFC